MTSLMQILVPIAVSAVAVFVASSLIHMVLKWHNSDYRGLSNEEDVRRVLRASNAAPGQYFIPHCLDHSELKKPEVQQKFVEGPIALVTVRRSGMPTMGAAMGQWFALTLVVSALVGYLACSTRAPGAAFGDIACITGLAAFLAYGTGPVVNSIWMSKPWGSTVKDILDALIFAAVTACVFGWLWPAR
jgi:hypothetical protein